MSNTLPPLVGVDPTPIPGPPGILPAGAWNSATAYTERQAVSYNGSTWLCLQPHTGVVPAEGPTWTLLARAGRDAVDGASAYDIWLRTNSGSVDAFLASLKGATGASAYDVWRASGYTGTYNDFLYSLKGADGASAYALWLRTHPGATEADFFASLKGLKGDTGDVTPAALAALEAARRAAVEVALRIMSTSDVAMITSISPIASSMEILCVPEGWPPVEYAYTRAGTDTVRTVYGNEVLLDTNVGDIDHATNGRVLGLKVSRFPQPSAFSVPATEWHNPNREGTFYVEWEYTLMPSNAVHTVLDVHNDTANNGITLQLNAAGLLQLQVVTAGATQVDLTVPHGRRTGIASAVITYKNNAVALAARGEYAATTVASTMPPVTRTALGCDRTGANALDGYVRRVIYFPRVVDEAPLRIMAASDRTTRDYFTSLGWPT